MMLTESEAKKKWCPLVRELSCQGDASFNRNGHGRIDCIGSACMAWRWAGPELYRGEPMPNAKGYCGAFGRPMGAQQ